MGIILNFILGSGLKMLAGAVGKFFENKRTTLLLIANAPIDKIKALQGGEDTLSRGGKATRRILSFMFSGVWCFILLYIVIVKSDLTFLRTIPYTPSMFSWIWGAADMTVIEESAGALLWKYQDVIAFIAGFYYTKISKGG